MEISDIHHIRNARYIIISKNCNSIVTQHIDGTQIYYVNKCFYNALASGILYKRHKLQHVTNEQINNTALDIMRQFQEFIYMNINLQNIVTVPPIFDDNMFDLGVYQAHLDSFCKNILHIRLNIYTGYTEYQSAWDLRLRTDEESKTTKVSVTPTMHTIPIVVGNTSDLQIDIVNLNNNHYEYVISIIEPITGDHQQILIKYQNKADSMIPRFVHLHDAELKIVQPVEKMQHLQCVDTERTSTFGAMQSQPMCSYPTNKFHQSVASWKNTDMQYGHRTPASQMSFSKDSSHSECFRGIPSMTEQTQIGRAEVRMQLEQINLEYKRNIETLQQQFMTQMNELNKQHQQQIENIEKRFR